MLATVIAEYFYVIILRDLVGELEFLIALLSFEYEGVGFLLVVVCLLNEAFCLLEKESLRDTSFDFCASVILVKLTLFGL